MEETNENEEKMAAMIKMTTKIMQPLTVIQIPTCLWHVPRKTIPSVDRSDLNDCTGVTINHARVFNASKCAHFFCMLVGCMVVVQPIRM
jgi:hypothetical protein